MNTAVEMLTAPCARPRDICRISEQMRAVQTGVMSGVMSQTGRSSGTEDPEKEGWAADREGCRELEGGEGR